MNAVEGGGAKAANVVDDGGASTGRVLEGAWCFADG